MRRLMLASGDAIIPTTRPVAPDMFSGRLLSRSLAAVGVSMIIRMVVHPLHHPSDQGKQRSGIRQVQP